VVLAKEEGAPKGGTGAVQKEKQEANGVNLGKKGCTALGAEVGEVQLFRKGQRQAQQRRWWGRSDVWVTASSSAGCPSGSESGRVGLAFPIIVGTKGVYPVCPGSPSTGTLCSPPTPAGTHPQLQADGLHAQGTSGLMSLSGESRKKLLGSTVLIMTQ